MSTERIDLTGFGDIKIIQNLNEFCYGIDAVLLASFVSPGNYRTIADLGTGNGIVPLILSYKTNASSITGIEVMRDAYMLACRNVELNGLESRLSMVNCNVKDVDNHFKKGGFDAVVSNPPYMASGAGITNIGGAKRAARHETEGSLEDFIKAAYYLLKDRGDFYMVHRPHRLADIMYSCRSNRLEPKELRFVSPKNGMAPNIMLIHCKKFGGKELKILPPLNVYNEDGSYTDEILRMYGRKDASPEE